MSRTIRSLRPASIVAGAAALALAALTTACSDGPTAPATSAAPAAEATSLRAAAAPSASLFQNYGFVRVIDGNGAPIKTTVLFAQWVNGKIAQSVSVIDNGTSDLDPDLGEVRAALPMSGGVVRVTATPSTIPWSGRGAAIDKTLLVGETNFGTLKMNKMPELIVDFRTFSGAIVKQGAITVRTLSDQTLLRYAADNSVADYDPTPGRIKTYYDVYGKVLVTEVGVESGVAFSNGSPFVAAIEYNASKVYTLLHALLK
jgi:hypothetical protein